MLRARIVRIGLATTMAGAVFALAACGGGDSSADHGEHGDDSKGDSSGEGFNEADVMFAQMMIPHHEQAVEMAEMAESQASDEEVLEIAGEIKDAQDPEIEQMTGWLEDWDKPVDAGDHSDMMEGMVSDEDMKAMKDASGAEFDKLFTEHMIAHHEGAIEMAKTQQADGEFKPAKELAADIESAQDEEISRMEDILQRL